MFTPFGKQKLLLQIKLAEDRGVADPLAAVLKANNNDAPSRPGSSSQQAAGSRPASSSSSSRRQRGRSAESVRVDAAGGAGEVISTSKLLSLLRDPGVDGEIMQRVLESTVRYRPDKDSIVLRAFQSKNIEYVFFRHFLREAFLLTFSDEEYEHLTRIFDSSDAGVIDGYSFMIAFIRLGGIRKDRHAAEKRKESEDYLNRVQCDEASKKEELEKKYALVGADFDYDSQTKEVALMKLLQAAKGYDPGHPSAPSLEAFEASHMSVALLRDTIRSAFNLRVNAKEIAAILQHFDDKDKGQTQLLRPVEPGPEAAFNPDSKMKQVDVHCRGFLRNFFRVGIDERDREKAEQRARQKLLDKQAAEDTRRKLHEAENKMSMSVDYDFGAADATSCLEKLKAASTKYDRNAPGCQGIDGFNCDSLSPGGFKDLIRRIFNLALTSKELGFIINKFDVNGTGNLVCGPFLTFFLKLGQVERYKHHIAQLDKQRRMIEEADRDHVDKMKAAIEGKPVPISSNFSDRDVASAREKLVGAAVYFDSSKPGALVSFEPQSLSRLDFVRAIKRTFNLTLTPGELGYIVSEFAPAGGSGSGSGSGVHCKTFLNSLFVLGHEERDRIRIEQLKRNREGERLIKEREEKKKYDMLNKTDIDVDFCFSDEDRDSALAKLLVASTKFDRGHPGSMRLDGFDCFSLKAPAFKEIVRRTFGLKLGPKEVGALVRHFDKSAEGNATEIECGDFITTFLQMGFAERANHHRAQLQRQRAEYKARAYHDAARLLETTQRGGANLQIDMEYTEKDMFSAVEKLVGAAEKYDKCHPAAPDISAFDIATMTPGIFRENMKRCFNIKFGPRELGFCIATYGNADDMTINSCDFMTKFIIMGKASLHEKHRKFLIKQRAATAAAKKEAEDRLEEQFIKAEGAVPLGMFDNGDLTSAMEKMSTAAFRFDKGHPSAPSTAVFTGGLMKPGHFRECVKNTFQLRLTPRETAALVDAFPWFQGDHKTGDVDTKAFMVKFIRLGFEARSHFKSVELEKQRAAEKEMADKAADALIAAGIGKADTAVDFNYTELERAAVYQKMTSASAKYDKNAPGCVSPEAFDAAFLTPHDFRQVMKGVFGLALSNKELAVLLNDFSDGAGNLYCKPFMIKFTKLGADERYKFSLAQLEKQREADLLRKTAHERAVKEAEEKLVVKVSYDFTPQERESAFCKLTACAKTYDKNAPGCMNLESFEQKVQNVVQFRESLKRTFGLILSPPELGAIMTYFDKTNAGHVVSREFIIYFLQIGQSERDKDHSASILLQRKEIEDRKQREEEALRAMWAKTELKVTQTFADEDKKTAMEKLAEAAFKFDPATPGPMGLTAFQAQYLSPAVFREMLKRSFNLRVSDAELAALIDEYESPSAEKHVDCRVFMVKFTQMGFERRNEVRGAKEEALGTKTKSLTLFKIFPPKKLFQVRLAQLDKNRAGLKELKEQHEQKTKDLADKMAEKADYSFSNDDFASALEKVRKCAANYDRGHPAAPSMSGFQGANMLPFEFKDMIMRCFHVALSGRELGALVKYWDTSETQTIDSQAFLAHFYKICRQEQERRRKTYIQKIRSLRKATVEQEEEIEKRKELEESQKILFSATDEVSFLAKLRKAAKLYAFDSAALQEPLQAFKGPALKPLAFRDIFSRVFSSIKLSFPEIGVLLSILDSAGVGSLDGPRFLNWFYKLGRIEGRIMLGEAENNVTLEGLRAAAASQQPVVVSGQSSDAANGPEKAIRCQRSQSRAQSSEGRLRSQSSIRSHGGTGTGASSDSPLTTSETVASIVAGLRGQPRPKSQSSEGRSCRSQSQSTFFQKKQPREPSPTFFPEGSGVDFPEYGAFLEAVELFSPKQPIEPRSATAATKKCSKASSKTKIPEIETLPKRPAGAELHTVNVQGPGTRRGSASSSLLGEKPRVVRGDGTATTEAATLITSTSMTANYLSTEVWTSSQLLSAEVPVEENVQRALPSSETLDSTVSATSPALKWGSAPEMAGMTSPISRRDRKGPPGTSSSADGPLPSRSKSMSNKSRSSGRQKLLIVKHGPKEKERSESEASFFFPNFLPQLGRIGSSSPDPFIPGD